MVAEEVEEAVAAVAASECEGGEVISVRFELARLARDHHPVPSLRVHRRLLHAHVVEARSAGDGGEIRRR